MLWDAKAGTMVQSQRYDVRLVDRIGGGDSFAAGMIFGLLSIGSRLTRFVSPSVRAPSSRRFPATSTASRLTKSTVVVAGDASGRVQR